MKLLAADAAVWRALEIAEAEQTLRAGVAAAFGSRAGARSGRPLQTGMAAASLRASTAVEGDEAQPLHAGADATVPTDNGVRFEQLVVGGGGAILRLDANAFRSEDRTVVKAACKVLERTVREACIDELMSRSPDVAPDDAHRLAVLLWAAGKGAASHAALSADIHARGSGCNGGGVVAVRAAVLETQTMLRAAVRRQVLQFAKAQQPPLF
jgi:hypothetical protein